jgi:hypothetical protein
VKLQRTLSHRFGATGAVRQDIATLVTAGFRGCAFTVPEYSDVIDEVLPIARNLAIDTGPWGLPGWDTARITTVARWGALLADISGGPKSDTQLLPEAAAFNVAVASFDTLVDEQPDLLPAAAHALHPLRLKQRLDGEISRLDPGEMKDPVRCVVDLFDYTLGGISRTYKDIPDEREVLSRLLAEMYRSELGLGDPLRAKSLPVVFIGRLGNGTGDREVDQLYESLAHFLAGWDDFVDLFIDWGRFAPNEFLRINTISDVSPRLCSAVVGSLRLVFAPRSHAELGRSLRVRALDAIGQANRCGRESEVEGLILALVQGAT